MSRLGQLRKKMGYETNIPRCEICAHRRKPYTYLTTNSMTKRAPSHCKLGDFDVQKNSCCDHWVGVNGDTATVVKIDEQAKQ